MSNKIVSLLFILRIFCSCLYGQTAEQKYNESLSYYNAYTGDFQKALDLVNEADNLLKKEGHNAELQWSIFLLKYGIQEYLIMRSQQDAHTLQMVSFAEKNFGKPSERYYEALTYRGLYLWNTIGDAERAEDSYKEALDWQIGNANYVGARNTANYLFSLYIAQEDYKKARKYLDKACELTQLMGYHNCDAQYYNEFTLLKREHRYDEAGALMIAQLKQLENNGYYTEEQVRANSVYFYVYLLDTFLEHYRHSGNAEYLHQANTFGMEAAKYFSEGYAQYFVPYFWQQYGHVLVYLGKPELAKQLYDGIYTAQTGILGQQSIPKTSYYMAAQARTLYEVQAYDFMRPILYEALELDKQQIKRDFPAFSEREKVFTYEKFLRANLDLLAEYSTNDKANRIENAVRLYNQIISVKGLLLQSQRKLRKQIEASSDKNLKEAYTKWINGKAYLSNTISSNQADAKELERITREIELLEKQLSSSYIGKNLFQTDIKWEDIKRNLESNEVAIEVLRFQKVDESVGYLALIIQNSSSSPTIVSITNGALLEEESILLYRDFIQYGDNQQEVYADFWSDIQQSIPVGTKRIYWSPDGAYNLININTLKNNDGLYLIDKYEIISVNHTRDLAASVKEGQVNTQVSLLGFPSYDLNNSGSKGGSQGLDSLTRFFSGKDISVLPGTKEEVKTITNILNQTSELQVKALLNHHASEANVKSVSNQRIIHIATHGYFLEDVLGSNDKNNFTQYLKNPLFRSGLLLANAQNYLRDGVLYQQEDGLLTAYEVADMDLNGTELVTLSACETGLGKVRNGEGVYGLQRAFLLAGTKRIINSLWLVDDNASKELMEYMYKEWVTNRDFRRSFRNAQLYLREKYPSPKEWGAFVLVEKIDN